jgi:purine nucleoside phosphorylase
MATRRAPLTFGKYRQVPGGVFIARHGYGHTIPPHLVNYRANIWALAKVKPRQPHRLGGLGGRHSCRSHARHAGGAAPNHRLHPWVAAIPFSKGAISQVVHVDFTHPYGHDVAR